MKDKKNMRRCGQCNVSVKIENYIRHMRNVHGIAVPDQALEGTNGGTGFTGRQSREERTKARQASVKGKWGNPTNVLTVCIILIGLVAATFLIYYGTSGGDSGGSFESSTATTPEAPRPGKPSDTTNATNNQTINSTAPNAPQGNTSDSVINIPVSSVSTTAKWYTYNSNGVNVRYFLVKGSDSKIHLATDACDVCYSQKKGYRQANAAMKCNNCGNEFAINSIGTENTAGGCWPSYLPMSIQSDYVVIKTSDLDSKRFMFV